MIDFYSENEISINDSRRIIEVIKNLYNLNLSDWSLTSLRRRLALFLSTTDTVNNFDSFINKLKEPKYFNFLMSQINVDVTEMFRDPSFWREVRDIILPELAKKSGKISVWFPNCSTGEEVFTFCIILKEQNFPNPIEILATDLNDEILAIPTTGLYSLTKMKGINSDNYERYQGKSIFSNYYKEVGLKAQMDMSLTQNVIFKKHNLTNDQLLENKNLIICRNVLIYFNQATHLRLLNNLRNSLGSGGFLALGIQEMPFSNEIGHRNLEIFSKLENIYKKTND